MAAGTAVAAHAVEVTPSARLHVDYARFDSDVAQFDNKTSVRRAQFGLTADFGSRFSAKVVYDFADGGSYKDAYVRYRGWGRTDLKLGQFKVPFGLEQLTSTNEITFVERSTASDAFALSRRKGIGLQGGGAKYTWAAMAFSPSIAGTGSNGAVARLTFNPVKEGDNLVHLGLSVLTQRPNGTVNIGARPEGVLTGTRLVRTGSISPVTRMDELGVEAAGKQGPVSIQGEWMQMRLSPTSSGPDVSFHGWYVAASWVVTGESRGYKDGVFQQVEPKRKAGAWELAARYSDINLNSGLIRGGKDHNVTVGINWYFTDYVRVMADYVKVMSDRRGVSDNPKILDLRFQAAF